jgi:heptaprenylglyceryl phosphate synthase
MLKQSAAEFFEAIKKNDLNKVVEILNENKNIVNEKDKVFFLILINFVLF